MQYASTARLGRVKRDAVVRLGRAVASRLTPRVRSALFDISASAGIGFLTLLEILRHRVDEFPSHAPPALGFGMAVALLFRRRWPLAVLSTVSTIALIQVLLSETTEVPLYDVAVFVAVYSVVKYAPRMHHAFLGGLLVAIPIGATVARQYSLPDLVMSKGKMVVREPDWGTPLFYAAVCTAVWLWGLTMRTRRRYLASVEERAATAERERDALARVAVADERAAIARELHDVVAHSLAVMVMQADGATYTMDSDPARARAATQTVADIGREAMEDMRRLVALLRGSEPAEDTDTRRPITIDRLVERARSAGLAVELRLSGPRDHLPPAVELTVHRLLQEALTNSLRHAGPGTHAVVRVDYGPDAVELEATDDGRATAPQPGGHGLIGMRERVAVHGGELSAGPIPEGGWRVLARVPLPASRP